MWTLRAEGARGAGSVGTWRDRKSRRLGVALVRTGGVRGRRRGVVGGRVRVRARSGIGITRAGRLRGRGPVLVALAVVADGRTGRALAGRLGVDLAVVRTVLHDELALGAGVALGRPAGRRDDALGPHEGSRRAGVVDVRLADRLGGRGGPLDDLEGDRVGRDLDGTTDLVAELLGRAERDQDVGVPAVLLGPVHVVLAVDLHPVRVADAPPGLPDVPEGATVGAGVPELASELDPALADRVDAALGRLDASGAHEDRDDGLGLALVALDQPLGLRPGDVSLGRRRRVSGGGLVSRNGRGTARGVRGDLRGRREDAGSGGADRVRRGRTGGSAASSDSHNCAHEEREDDRPRGDQRTTKH